LRRSFASGTNSRRWLARFINSGDGHTSREEGHRDPSTRGAPIKDALDSPAEQAAADRPCRALRARPGGRPAWRSPAGVLPRHAASGGHHPVLAVTLAMQSGICTRLTSARSSTGGTRSPCASGSSLRTARTNLAPWAPRVRAPACPSSAERTLTSRAESVRSWTSAARIEVVRSARLRPGDKPMPRGGLPEPPGGSAKPSRRFPMPPRGFPKPPRGFPTLSRSILHPPRGTVLPSGSIPRPSGAGAPSTGCRRCRCRCRCRCRFPWVSLQLADHPHGSDFFVAD
jgi:hypothetical protein